MNRIPANRVIGAGFCFSSGFAALGGTYLKNIIPISGIIGWSLGVIFLFCAMYFLGKQKS